MNMFDKALSNLRRIWCLLFHGSDDLKQIRPDSSVYECTICKEKWISDIDVRL